MKSRSTAAPFAVSPAVLTRLVATALSLCAAVPALAQDGPVSLPQFSMPRGCETVVIVQSSDCRANVVYTCEGDTGGERHIATVSAEGMTYHSTVSDTFTWLYSIDSYTGEFTETQLPVADSIDVGALVANGVDSFALTQIERSTGNTIIFQGYDWLTGTETVIDGVRLLESEFQVRATYADGTPYFSAAGTEYVDPDLGLFHEGRVWYDGDRENMWVSAPVEFVLPGEPNDTLYSPIYGCE